MKSKALLIASAVLIVVLLSFIFLRKSSSNEIASSEAAVSTAEATEGSTGKPSITIDGQPLNDFAITTPSEVIKPTVTLSSQPLSNISASQIDRVEPKGSSWLVTFIDGSKSYIGEALRNQLPAEVRYRMEYQLEN